MSIFLIDYENVNERGFKGILNCQKEDLIYIFYTKNGSTLSFDSHKLLEEAKPKIDYFNAENGSKNALDFQLSSFLGYLITNHPNEQFYIISKDKGYEVLIRFWSSFKGLKVKIGLLPNLVIKNTPKIVKEVILSPKEKLLKSKYKENTEEVLTIIDKYNTKLEINNALCKAFESKIGGEIYNVVKPFLKDKIGDVKK